MSVIIPTSKPKAKRPFHMLSKPAGPLCNLDCEYCFYLDKTEFYPETKKFDMGMATLEAHIKSYIESQPVGCKEVTFGWQGGEPTLRGLEFYQQAIVLQRKYARSGMKITNTIQTNGVLLNDSWANFFKENDFLVGISIDGDEALHDHYRKTRSGKGSYQKVIKGLKLLQKYNVEFNVLTVIQNNNSPHGKRVYQHLKKLGATFIQFIPIVEAEKGKGVSERSVRPEQFGQFMIDVFDEWRKADIGKIYISHFDNALGMHLGMPSSVCVHSPQCGENMVIEHNGDVYSCDHFVFSDFKVGNINRQDYPDLIETPIQQQFSMRKPIGSHIHCQDCEQRSLCHGACPAQRIDEHGLLNVTAKHYLCRGYFMFFSYLRPYLAAMGQCIQQRIPASSYLNFMPN